MAAVTWWARQGDAIIGRTAPKQTADRLGGKNTGSGATMLAVVRTSSDLSGLLHWRWSRIAALAPGLNTNNRSALAAAARRSGCSAWAWGGGGRRRFRVFSGTPLPPFQRFCSIRGCRLPVTAPCWVSAMGIKCLC